MQKDTMQRLGEIIGQNVPEVKPDKATLLQMRVDSYNNAEGNLTGVDCPLCKNKGFIMRLRHNAFYNCEEEYVVECECNERRKILAKAKKSGLGDYLKKTFNDYETAEQWQRDIWQRAYDYTNSDGQDWYVILGQSGAGKTLICSIIANVYLFKRNKSVVYITWTDFISRIKRDMMSDNAGAVSKYIDEIKNAEILFIDELLKKYNETDLKYIIEIINYRYTENLKTIISSERTPNELLDIDEATFGRMVEKAGRYITNVPKDRKKNYRLKNII